MKKIITAVAVVALSSSLAMAAPYAGGEGRQHRGGRAHQGEGMMAAEKLNLSYAQKEQMKAMRQSFRDENKAFFDSVKTTRQQLREARQAGDTARAQQLA